MILPMALSKLMASSAIPSYNTKSLTKGGNMDKWVSQAKGMLSPSPEHKCPH